MASLYALQTTELLTRVVRVFRRSVGELPVHMLTDYSNVQTS